MPENVKSTIRGFLVLVFNVQLFKLTIIQINHICHSIVSLPIDLVSNYQYNNFTNNKDIKTSNDNT